MAKKKHNSQTNKGKSGTHTPKKINPKSKRGKKKQLNKRTQQVVKEQGFTEKQVRQMSAAEREAIVKKADKAAKARALYAKKKAYINYWYLSGVKPSDSWDKIHAAFQERSKEVPKKRRWFKEKGISFTQQDLYKPWALIEHDYNLKSGSKIYHSKYKMFAGVYDYRGNIDIKRVWAFYENHTLDEMRNAMSDSYYYTGQRGSPEVATDIHLNYDRPTVSVKALVDFDRKYGFDVVYTGDWTLKGAMKFITGIMDVSRVEDIEYVYKMFATYLKENIPELWEQFDLERR